MSRIEPGDTVRVRGTNYIGIVVQTRNIPVWATVEIPLHHGATWVREFAPSEMELISKS